MGATLTATVPGKPVPQGRPRFSRKSGGRPIEHPRAIDPLKSRQWKREVARIVREAAEGADWHRIESRRAVRVRIVAVYQRPKSLPGDERTFHTVRPDADNLAKPTKDAITASGRVWRDDCQVAIEEVVKVYGRPGEAPRVEILIEALA